MFLKSASQMVDKAYGYMPVAGPINDTEQLLIGYFTGSDYTGKQMEKSDYLIRAFNIVMGLLPVSQKLIQIGATTVDQLALNGISQIRKFKDSQSLFKAITQNYSNLQFRIASIVGRVFSLNSFLDEVVLQSNMVQVLKHLNPELNQGGVETVQKLCTILESAEVCQLAKIQIIASYEVGSIRFQVANDELHVFRWHNADDRVRQNGRFFSFSEIDDKKVARNLLSLPNFNKMKFLDEFSIPANTPFIQGIVGPNFNKSGGGTQVFLYDETKAIFIKNIKHPLFRF